MDNEGTYKGFDNELLKKSAELVEVPVIASSGLERLNMRLNYSIILVWTLLRLQTLHYRNRGANLKASLRTNLLRFVVNPLLRLLT